MKSLDRRTDIHTNGRTDRRTTNKIWSENREKMHLKKDHINLSNHFHDHKNGVIFIWLNKYKKLQSTLTKHIPFINRCAKIIPMVAYFCPYMRENYVNMQEQGARGLIYVDMRLFHLNMLHVFMLTCEIFTSTCQIIMLTCDFWMSTCALICYHSG